jgi:hypothetical protein
MTSLTESIAANPEPLVFALLSTLTVLTTFKVVVPPQGDGTSVSKVSTCANGPSTGPETSELAVPVPVDPETVNVRSSVIKERRGK